ncbi:endolytic transglycosylase MltG [Streptomyces beijiangensis]|uniref:Endolytic murein transglycosylase n=1 Tax=Streptomyces beijiangensis TaxID=163361 RepID=A0A939F6A1_9ACTN|nr:endolytic transglycosylase MltG [Streptomyces beijiangensis]MBO0511170.1 endolytic transglycosylase MltG [Streptomyces beijiangensis]
MPNDKLRITRRGRLILLAVTGVVVAAAVAVLAVLLIGGGDSGQKPPLVIPEGWRAVQVYAASDKSLGVAPGTTEKAAGAASLKLPSEARGNPEGYLFPATYPIDAQTTPAGLLTYMVNTANRHFGADHITQGARRNDVTVYQTVTIASIVQAEADTTADMGKVSRVIYNRLAQGMPLQMDSTLNYALNRSTLDTTTGDTKIDSPFNTYERKGLPPTPIGNPGQDAMNAAINPTPGNWLYFVTVAPGDTRFTDSYSEQQKNVQEFNRNQKSARS